MNKLSAIFLLSVVLVSCGGNKIGYVDIHKLYESFEYKKKLTVEFNTVKTARQRITDSLERELNQMASYIESENKFGAEVEKQFEQRKKYFFQLSKQYEEDNMVLLESYNEKILKQLNAYIREYGKKNNYELLMGGDEKGSVLYGDEKIDVTGPLTEFVNERYKGEKAIK